MSDQTPRRRYYLTIAYLHPPHEGQLVNFHLDLTDRGGLVSTTSSNLKHEHELKQRLSGNKRLWMRICQGRFQGDFEDFEHLMGYIFRDATANRYYTSYYHEDDTMDILLGTIEEIDHQCAAIQDSRPIVNGPERLPSSPARSNKTIPETALERSNSNISIRAVVGHPQPSRAPDLKASQSQVEESSQLKYYRRQALDLQQQLEAQEALVDDVITSASHQKYLFRIHVAGVHDRQSSLKVLGGLPDELKVRMWATKSWGSDMLDQTKWALRVLGGMDYEDWKAIEVASDKRTVSNRREDVPEIYLIFSSRTINSSELRPQQPQITVSQEPALSIVVAQTNAPPEPATLARAPTQAIPYLRVSDMPTIPNLPPSSALSSPPSYRSGLSTPSSQPSMASSFQSTVDGQRLSPPHPERYRIASPSPTPSMYRAAVAAARFNLPVSNSSSLSGLTLEPRGRQQAPTSSPARSVPFSPPGGLSNSVSSLASDIILTPHTSPSNSVPPTPYPAPSLTQVYQGSNEGLWNRLDKLGPMMDDAKQVAAWINTNEAIVNHPFAGNIPPESSGVTPPASPPATQKLRGPRVFAKAKPLPTAIGTKGVVSGQAVIEDDSRLVHRPPQGYPSSSSRSIKI
ncbi:hypothetical protein L198_01937 [Cryptococcus wingfieldii CBS 7118]|uniref:Uncharacterized protein n=1 Tax=Cryptococcus wingfieldii CBS 7118 TaxID=1295528 RepID=A0A1E3JWX2_9TREE|nr:hypothetical protein L198_01937 [Cryptococcus wingfieldii CBS 7118]ODO05246.1 hypothetical protein L198_01937 [Cryptococcus wingfieldii CBS 7118]